MLRGSVFRVPNQDVSDALPDLGYARLFTAESAPTARSKADMLQPMQQPASSASSLDSASFAGLLAALTSAPKKTPPAWNDDELADDVATLSYERALHTHNRTTGRPAADRALSQPSLPDSDGAFPPTLEEPGPTRPLPQPQFEAGAGCDLALAGEKNLKDASITIRLSRAECAQLRKRAAEAGLTVSAYMRSCTFEAESLRALVKDTLANLRSAPTPGQGAKARPGAQTRLAQLAAGQHLPHALIRQGTARA